MTAPGSPAADGPDAAPRPLPRAARSVLGLPWVALPGILIFGWAVLRAGGVVRPWFSVTIAVIAAVYMPVVVWLALDHRTLHRQRQDDLVELADSRRRFTSVAEATDEMVWEVEVDGTIAFVGPTVIDFLGYRADELVGRSMLMLLPAFEQARAVKHYADSSYPATGWQNMLWTYRAQDGSLRAYMCTAVAHADASGHAVAFAGTLRRQATVRADLLLDDLRGKVADVISAHQLTIHFQPILDTCSGKVIGAESLSRFTVGDPARTPDAWFADAARVGLGADLELLAVETALLAGKQLPPDIYLSINLSPETLLTGRLDDVLAGSGWQPDRVVLEVTEHVSIDNYESLARSVADLRRDGMRLAIDDAGAGYASLRHILQLAPDYIKLDRSLITDLDADPGRRALVKALLIFAGEVGATVIAEGVETMGELDAAHQLGVQAAQGFLTGRPVPVAEWRPTEPRPMSHPAHPGHHA